MFPARRHGGRRVAVIGVTVAMTMSMLVGVMVAPAGAGAYLQPQGRTQIIVTGRFERSDAYVDGAGRRIPVRDYRKFELQAWNEYGYSDHITLIAAATWSRIASTAPPTPIRAQSPLRAQMAGIEVGARMRIGAFETSALSVQASVRAAQHFRATPNGAFGTVLMREPQEFDLRLLYARNFALAGRTGYVDLQAGYRARSGRADELRADATLGFRVWPRLILLVQNFNAFSLGGDRDRSRRTHKLQTSLVYAPGPRWSVQAGVFSTVAARKARRDNGVLAAVWRAF